MNLKMMESTIPFYQKRLIIIRMMHLGHLLATIDSAWMSLYFTSFKINVRIRTGIHSLSLTIGKWMSLSPFSHVFRMTGKTVSGFKRFWVYTALRASCLSNHAISLT